MVDRTETSVTFGGDAGARTTLLYDHPVNYRDGSGVWQVIDPRLVPSPSGFRNRSGPLDVRFAAAGDADKVVTISGTGWSVGYGLAGATPAVGVIDSADIRYPSVVGDADVSYRVGSYDVKEIVTLDRRPAGSGPVAYRFPLSLAGVAARQADSGIEFVDGDGVVVGVMPVGVAFDSSGDGARVEPARAPASVTLVEHGAGQAVELSVDGDWLRAPEREFPVMIDPSFVAGRDAGGGDAFIAGHTPDLTYNGGYQTDDGHTYKNKFGYGFGVEFVGFTHYNTSPIAGKRILSSTWWANVLDVQGSNPGSSFAISPVGSAWGESSVTYNNHSRGSTATRFMARRRRAVGIRGT